MSLALDESAAPILEVREVAVHFSGLIAIASMSFAVPEGEIVSLIGPNGAGKTTALDLICGKVKPSGGTIMLGDRRLNRLEEQEIARAGVGRKFQVPSVFRDLSVRENLVLPPVVRPGGLSLDEVHALFPRLQERATSQGTKLSGGEQQMLAIARILRTGASLLLLDEPTEGLAPVIVQHIGAIIRQLKERGFTILLVEHKFHFAATVADRHYVVEHGRVVDMIPNADLSANMGKLKAYLGV